MSAGALVAAEEVGESVGELTGDSAGEVAEELESRSFERAVVSASTVEVLSEGAESVGSEGAVEEVAGESGDGVTTVSFSAGDEDEGASGEEAAASEEGTTASEEGAAESEVEAVGEVVAESGVAGDSELTDGGKASLLGW